MVYQILAQGPTRAVVVAERGVADLPCNLTSPLSADPALLVLWYKQGVTKPIYSYDLREGLASHWRSPHHLGTRAVFHASTHVPFHASPTASPNANYDTSTLSHASYLRIRGVLGRDRGTYKCRVDFRANPTLTFTTNLTVMVPPRRLSVYTDEGVLVHQVVGPFKEGDTLRLSCRASGGSPLPRITWWDGSNLLDLTSEIQEGGEVRSMLVVPTLTRGDLQRVFTCRAVNSNLTQPLVTSVTLDMHLPPLWVRLLSSREALSAGWPYSVVCQAAGSRPPAVFTWHLRHTTLTTHTEQWSDGDNVTTSELVWTPTLEDNSAVLRCEAASPAIPSFTLHDQWTLLIYYVPVVTLAPGPSIDLDNIKEGVDVYFECSITSNPRVYNVFWLHEGEELRHNVSAGVIIGNHILVLQKVDKTASGNYHCVASNIQGDGHSNPLRLRVKYAPVCRQPRTLYHGAARFELVNLPCHVDAYPDPHSFRWTFNNSGESVEIPQEHIRVTESMSTVSYAPNTELDYGTLLCWGVNAVGLQHHPCVFHVFPADHPDPVHNCSVNNVSTTWVSIQCVAGFDGGLPQTFVLELYDIGHDRLLANTTNTVPVFLVVGLVAGVTMEGVVYSYNNKGRSEEVPISASTTKDLPERRMAAVKPSPTVGEGIEVALVKPVTAVMVGVAGGLLLVLLIVCVVVRRGRHVAHGDDRVKDKGLSVCITQVEDTRLQGLASNTTHEDNPDVIPQLDSTLLNGKRVTTISSASLVSTYDVLPGYQPVGGGDMQQTALLQRGATTTPKLEYLDPQQHTHTRLCYPTYSHTDARNMHKSKRTHRKKQQELHQQHDALTTSPGAIRQDHASWTSTSATTGQKQASWTPSSGATGQEYSHRPPTPAQRRSLRRDHHIRDPESGVALMTNKKESVV
ncbi:nephrin-like [Homarus americanus]|uniref:nephrin-like n=1 Tax=Homarus americanus TaxID=6706 RepID=UPI001C44FAA0|nr:nephrin-like [Homarus americanus]